MVEVVKEVNVTNISEDEEFGGRETVVVEEANVTVPMLKVRLERRVKGL